MKINMKNPEIRVRNIIKSGIIIIKRRRTKNPKILMLNFGLVGNTFILQLSQNIISFGS